MHGWWFILQFQTLYPISQSRLRYDSVATRYFFEWNELFVLALSEHWHLCERIGKVVCHVRLIMHRKVDTIKLDQPMFRLKSCFQRSLRLWKTFSLAVVYCVRASITTVETNGLFDTRPLLLPMKRCLCHHSSDYIKVRSWCWLCSLL
jgi:hypothetical protein